MADSGVKYPTVNDATNLYTSTPANLIDATETTYATTTSIADTQEVFFAADVFAAIPDTATITGIVIGAYHYEDGAGDLQAVRPCKAGAPVGTAYNLPQRVGSGLAQWDDSSNQMWGTTWSVAQIKASGTTGFGAEVSYTTGTGKNAGVAAGRIRVTVYYTVPATACEVYAAEAILDYEVPPAEVYAAEAILDYTGPAEVYAAEAVLDYEVPPAEVYAAEAILDYTAPAEAYAAEAILDYTAAVQPAEVYAAEAVLDYEVPPTEVYAAEVVLDYEVPPAEVYAAEAVLDYEVPPAEVYAAEVILDYELPEVEAATSGGFPFASSNVVSSPGRFGWPIFQRPPDEEPEEPRKPRMVAFDDSVDIDDYSALTRSFVMNDEVEITDGLAIDKWLAGTDELTIEDESRVDQSLILDDSVTIDDTLTTTSNSTLMDLMSSPAFRNMVRGSTSGPLVFRGRTLDKAEKMRLYTPKGRRSPLGNRMKGMRDPSLTRTIRNGYAASMDKLFVSFKRNMAKILGVRNLEEYAPDMASLLPELDETIELTIIIPAKVETGKYTTQAYTAGGMRGTQFLNALNLKVDFVMVPADKYALDVLQARNLSALKGISDEMSKEIMRIITDGVSRGDGVRSIAREISRSIDTIGRARANMMARTETMKAFNAGAKTQFEKHGITEVEWLANGPNMCEECEALNGRKFPMDDAPDCPLHPNCVCILLPVIPEID